MIYLEAYHQVCFQIQSFCCFLSGYLSPPLLYSNTPGALIFLPIPSLCLLSLHFCLKASQEKRGASWRCKHHPTSLPRVTANTVYKKELQSFSGCNEPLNDLLCMEIYCTQSVNKSDKLMQLGKCASSLLTIYYRGQACIHSSSFQSFQHSVCYKKLYYSICILVYMQISKHICKI